MSDIEYKLFDPKVDYVFKILFGDEEDKSMLISLLNAILRGRPTIKDLTLHNTKIGKILEKFFKAGSAFENKLVTYKVTASSAFENVKVFG